MSTQLKPKIIKFKKVSERDGCLTVAETDKELPFTVKRVFWISDVPAGMERANHACKNSDTILICIKGQLKVALDTGEVEREYLLDSSEMGILVPRLVWMKISDFSQEAVLLVLSSEKYLAEEYCEDYKTFLKEKDGRNEEGKDE